MSRVLVAGVGNVFLGDDGFGVEVVARLQARDLPPGVEVADFGTRGFDLAMALSEEWTAAILVDTMPRGEVAGSLWTMELDPEAAGPPTPLQGHGLHPLEVLRLIQQFGAQPPPLYLVGCEPAAVGEMETAPGLTSAVAAAVEPAVALVETLVAQLVETAEVS